MKANPMFWKLAGIASIAMAGSAVAIACSSNDNPGPSTTLEAGTGDDATSSGSSGGSSGSSSGSSGSSSGSSSSGSSGSSGSSSSSSSGGATCTDAGSFYNACSPFGCVGKYDNAAHKVPNPLPAIP